ncbi:MAG: MipA/OmpV family protein [Rhodanobacter sp.]
MPRTALSPQNPLPSQLISQRGNASASPWSLLLAATLAGALTPGLAMAQDADMTTSATTPTDSTSRWDVTVGAGGGVRPTYEGSNRHMTIAVPYVAVTYDNWLSLGPNGLNAYGTKGNLRFGGGVTGASGRLDHDSDNLFKLGDDRLRGLREIQSAPGLRAFASYKLGRINIGGSVTKFYGSSNHQGDPKNKGLLVSVGAAIPLRITEKLTITTAIGATWADAKYAQTFFGVTEAQSAHSQFAPFKASSGLKSVDADLSISYRFNRHWSVQTLLQMKALTGNAAESPVTFADNEASFFTTINYHF